jgi:hypothetical protein
VEDNLNPYVPERVYDRSRPTRIGTIVERDEPKSTVRVKWQDMPYATWCSIDHVGAIPPDYQEDETEEAYLRRKGRWIGPLS